MQDIGRSKKRLKIAIISDGTGETASAVSRAIMASSSKVLSLILQDLKIFDPISKLNQFLNK